MLMARHAAAHRHLHKKPKKTLFDYVLYFFVIATPLFELPQAFTIFHTKSAAGVSISTWSFFVIASLVWIIYSLRHKEWPLFVTSSLYVVIELAIVVGIIQYR